MSQTPPSRRPAAAADKLRAFRERAAVILAQERGFTPQCRIKLARLAGELGLSDGQAEEAIRSLREKAQPKAADPIVEKFRQRLKKDLSGRHRTVIGPEIEARVIESAQRKYGIDADTVRGVLAEVSAELGLRHITGDQAVQLYAEVVDQAIGDATWMAREAWDRLRTAGEKWGLSFEESDELIEQKIAANRRTYAAGRLWNRLVLGGSLALVAIAGASLGGLYYANRPKRDTPHVKSNGSAAPRGETDRKKLLEQPAWWDVDLAVAMATSRREIPDVAEMYDDLRADDSAARQKAYARLVELSAKVDRDHPAREQIVTLLAGCHALEPDESGAARLREALLKLVPGSDARLTGTKTAYQRAYFAVETALTLLERQGMPAARAEALAAELGNTIGTRIAPSNAAEPQSLAAVHAALTRTLYRHLTAKGPEQPDEAATQQAFLEEQASAWLTPTEIERLNVGFLVAMLTGAEQTWRTFQPLMESVCQSRDPLIVLQMLDVFRKVENQALQRALGTLLVRRTGARPRSDDPRQIARAVRQALGAAGVAVAQSAEDRWEDLRASVEPVLARRPASPADRAALLAETTELASLATRAMALAQGEPGFAIFDELSRHDDEADSASEAPVDDATSARGSGARLPPVKGRPRTNQERQTLARSIAALEGFENLSPVVRANALRIVASRVPLADDLTYEQATVVARYLLAPKVEGETESMLSAIEALRAWKQVRLAVADRLSESKLTVAQRDQVLGALLGSLEPPSGATAAVLRKLLMRDVLTDVEAPSPASSEGQTPPALEALAETYRQRARALAVSAADYETAQSPASALEMVVRALARRHGAHRSAAEQRGASLTHRLEAVRFLAADDPQRTVLLQRLFVDLIAERVAAAKPQQTSAAAQIASNLAAADAAQSDLLAQLRSGERATLEMWMLFEVP